MADKIEFRNLNVEELRSDAETGVITGYAAVFDQEARIWDFDEVIRRGAFRKTISDGADVFAFWSHDGSKVIGRTTNGTLELAEDKHGLRVKIRPPATPTGQEALALVRDGFVDKMSFGFEVLQEQWTQRDEKPDLREIKEVKLYEVSPVPIPAYAGTACDARGYKPERPNEQDAEAGAAPCAGTPSGVAASIVLNRFKLKMKEGQ